MQKWSGENYIGKRFNEYFVLYTQNRDSGILEQSNFRCIEKYLKAKKAVYEKVSFNHWAVGWIEQILIQDTEKESINIGNEIEEKLKGYPIFDEGDFCNLESDKAHELLEEIRKDISNLDTDEELKYWGNEFNKHMTDEEIINTIYDTGMIES